MVALPQIGRKLAHKRHKRATETSDAIPNVPVPGALAALLQEFRDEAAQMSPEQVAAEDAAWVRAGETPPRLLLPVPDVSGHD